MTRTGNAPEPQQEPNNFLTHSLVPPRIMGITKTGNGTVQTRQMTLVSWPSLNTQRTGKIFRGKKIERDFKSRETSGNIQQNSHLQGLFKS